MIKKKKVNLYHLDARLTSRVRIIHADKTFENKDARRSLTGLVGHFKFPFPIKQIKLIEFSNQSVSKGLIVGNHRHLPKSGQWEIVLVLGDNKKESFVFKYKNRNDTKIYESRLRGGDMAIIPPGCTLAFKALDKGVKMLEISNQEYNVKNYAKEDLF